MILSRKVFDSTLKQAKVGGKTGKSSERETQNRKADSAEIGNTQVSNKVK